MYDSDMPMGTERSKPLHNFTMPSGLRWGNQRFLSCKKVNSADGQISHLRRFATNKNISSPDQHHRRTTRGKERDPSAQFLHRSSKLGSTLPQSEDGDDGIAAMREKVMFDLQTETDKMKEAIFKESPEGEQSLPLNLRTRRAAGRTSQVKNPGGGDGMGLRVDAAKPINFAQLRGMTPVEKAPSPILSNGGDGGAGREKFSVRLSKREIEEDFVGLVGVRLPRRPKKRSKYVQRQLDTLFPGLWLTEVLADMYKVLEVVP